MQRTERVAERLPEFYKSWDHNSVLYKLIDAFSRSLNEQQQDLFRVARTHWVETAHHSDLDALGGIFDLDRATGESDDDYRRRIKDGVQQFRGGGTRESVISIVAAFLKTRRDELKILENPPVTLAATRFGAGDTEWNLGSMSIEDASPKIEITVETEGERIVDPCLTVKETGVSVLYRGTVAHGQSLVIEGAHAQLDGLDVSGDLERGGELTLRRSGSTWVFHEALSSLVGSYDHAIFDSSVFQKPVPTVRMRLEWVGRQPSTFELSVPGSAARRSGTSLETLAGLLNIIRAQGVSATLRIRE